MKWVVSSDEMRNIDARAIKEIGIPGSTLMERAGIKIVEYCIEVFGNLDGRSVLIFCGKGNNGGDGLVVAREMKRLGAQVEVFIFGSKDNLSGDTKKNYNILKKMDMKPVHISSSRGFNNLPDQADIIVDALLGTGTRGEVTGILGNAIAKINSITSAAVVAVDLPSGLNADTGTYSGDCVEADLTVTMGLLKRGLLLYPGKMKAGEVRIADIGFPTKAIASEKIKTLLTEQTDISMLMPKRHPYFSKVNCGKVMIVGGAPGMTGAAALAALGALRAGAGMTMLGIPRGINATMEQKLTETMTLPLPETEDGFLSSKAEEVILDALGWADVLGIGPGIGRNEETIDLVLNLLKKVEIPIVLDADGLYALSTKPGIIKRRKYPTLLTPHQGEFARIINEADVDAIQTDRIEILRKYTHLLKTSILLKGAPTLVGGRDGVVYINPTGNAGMATAGAGDVLTGIISGLIGQGMDSTYAGVAGSYIHGLAGDILESGLGAHSMIAGDLVEALPDAFGEILGLFDSDDE